MKYTRNEDAVSPVIGVILMVVITVIIAAIMAVFAFGVGAPEKAPSISVKISSWNLTSSNVTIYHNGGDAARLADIKLIVEQANVAGDILGRTEFNPVTTDPSIKFVAGDRLEFNTNKTTATISMNSGAAALNTASIKYSVNGTTGLSTGNTVSVTVVHRPTESVLSKPSVDI